MLSSAGCVVNRTATDNSCPAFFKSTDCQWVDGTGAMLDPLGIASCQDCLDTCGAQNFCNAISWQGSGFKPWYDNSACLTLVNPGPGPDNSTQPVDPSGPPGPPPPCFWYNADGMIFYASGNTSTCVQCQQNCMATNMCYDWTWNNGTQFAYDNSTACAIADAACRWFTPDMGALTVTGDPADCSACQAGCSQLTDCQQYSWQGAQPSDYDNTFQCTGVRMPEPPPEPDYPAPPGDPSPPPANCSRPTGWCNDTISFVAALDCDGDGLLDQACGNVYGQRWVILSSAGCVEGGNGFEALSACPAFFNSEWQGRCKLLCSTLYGLEWTAVGAAVDKSRL